MNAQVPRQEDPWLGGDTARVTPKQRHNMIAASCQRNGHVGCDCSGCKVHPGARCPLWLLPPGADPDRFLTPQHGPLGPADHRLSNVDAFCEPCNRNAGKVSSQRRVRVSVRKSPGGGRASAGASVEQSIRLVVRHEWERPAWDEWIVRSDKEGPWARLRDEGLMEGDWAFLQDLVDLAAGTLEDPNEGKGSSVTFRRYAMEDRFTALEMARTKGRVFVRLRKEGRPK